MRKAKTYAIRLKKYNEIGKLLIETETTGSQGTYAIRTELEGIYNTVAIHMGGRETGMWTWHRGAYNWSPSWIREVHTQLLQSNQRSISMQQDGNRCKRKRLQPSGLRPADEVAWVAHGCVVIMWWPCDVNSGALCYWLLGAWVWRFQMLSSVHVLCLPYYWGLSISYKAESLKSEVW